MGTPSTKGMARQATIGDRSPVYDHYDANTELYDYIQDRLTATKNEFLNADRARQWQMLDVSAEFAICSTNTRVSQHETGFMALQALDSPNQNEIADALHEGPVMYHNNKARYIYENRRDADRDSIIEAIEADDLDTAQDLIVNEYLGLANMKAAFTLAMLGFDEKMCVDTNVAQNVGMDRNVAQDLKRDDYEELCVRVREIYSDLAGQVSNFLWQWITFDQFRGENVTHDPFFLALGIDI